MVLKVNWGGFIGTNEVYENKSYIIQHTKLITSLVANANISAHETLFLH